MAARHFYKFSLVRRDYNGDRSTKSSLPSLLADENQSGLNVKIHRQSGPHLENRIQKQANIEKESEEPVRSNSYGLEES